MLPKPENSPVEIVGIVNSFDRLALLREGLPSLLNALKSCEIGAAIVVFDAGSSDGSRQWVEEFASQNAPFRLIQIASAPGEPDTFSDGINRACARAREEFPAARWFFLFETDNWIASATPLRAALELAQSHPNLGAVGFTVRKHDGRGTGYGCAFPTVAEFALGPQFAARLLRRDAAKAAISHPEIKAWECDVVYTSPLLVARESWEATRGLDAENFPFSDCDLDWAWRLEKAGWKQGVIQSDEVVHDNRASLSGWSDKRVFHFHRARLALLKRHRRPKVALLKIGLVMRHAAEMLVLAALPHRPFYRRNLRKRWELMRAVARDYRAFGES